MDSSKLEKIRSDPYLLQVRKRSNSDAIKKWEIPHGMNGILLRRNGFWTSWQPAWYVVEDEFLMKYPMERVSPIRFPSVNAKSTSTLTPSGGQTYQGYQIDLRMYGTFCGDDDGRGL